MTINELNTIPEQEAFQAFEKCCGATTWITKMVKSRPFKDEEALLQLADENWDKCSVSDWLEAFKHHPKIGDISSLAKKYANTKEWAGNEQQSVQSSSSEIITQLANGNTAYENKFRFIFIVCATGKSAKEMLELLNHRLPNNREEEVKIAAEEQHKITRIRLKKLMDNSASKLKKMSQITTHVLDTSKGTPAEGIKISLQKPTSENKWETITSGMTNSDGRIEKFLPEDKVIPPGIYRMLFDTKAYFEHSGLKSFYPYVPVVFEIFDTEHYHVPLLLNPFGYSTYRGS